MTLTLLAALAVSPFQASTPFEFSAPAARAKTVLPALGQALGVNLQASPAMEDEILLILVHGVAPKDVLAKIATVTAGAWREADGVFRLVPDVDVRRIEANREQAKRVAELQALIAKRIAASQPSAPKSASIFEANAKSADEVVVNQLLRRIPLGDLAAMGPNDRLVFSTSPTAVQRPIDAAAIPDITRWIEAHNAALPKESPKEDPQMAAMPDFIKDMVEARTRRVTSAPKKAILIARQMPFLGTSTMIELKAYDAAGTVVINATSLINADALADLVSQMTAPKPAASTNSATKTPIVYRPESKEFMAALKGLSAAGGGGMSIAMPAPLRAKLFHPEQSDPLSFMATDSLTTLASARKRSIVAVVPDEMFSSILGIATGQSPTLEDFTKTIDSGKVATLSDDGAILTLRPAQPTRARANRLDRKALATLLKSVDEKELPGLDDLAAYAQHADSPLSNNVASVYLGLFAPSALSSGLSGIVNWEMVRFYGSLGLTQRQSLVNGGRIPFSNLGSNQLNSLGRIVYGPMAMLQIDRPNEKPADVWTKTIRMFAGGGKDYRDEPTEALPTGLPPQAYVTLNVQQDSFIKAEASGGQSSFAVLGTDEIAAMRFFKDMPGFGAAGAIKLPERGRLGRRTVYNFTFRLGPGISMAETLQDNSIAKDAQVVSLDGLPGDMNKRIDEKYAAMKQSPIAAMAALGAGRGRSAIP